MRDPDQFDAFYAATRERLLRQTFAVTGDLPSSRQAVREAFASTWQHWRRVGDGPDPESRVRARAWMLAHRPHPGRVLRRTGHGDPEARATLEALAELTATERQVLVLEHLSALPMVDLARETGLTRDAAAATLATATERYVAARDTDAGLVRAQLAGLPVDHDLPPGAVVRRTGRARRRTLATLAAAAAVTALVGTGLYVADQDRISAAVTAERSGDGPSPVAAAAAPPRLDPASLVTLSQVAALDPGGRWVARPTHSNSSGAGLYAPCQTARYADPEVSSALVRRFVSPPSPGRATVTVVQASELSGSVDEARRTFATTVGWYAGCTEPRTTLVHTWRVGQVGDRGTILELRRWGRTPSVVTVGVARTGRIVTTTVRTAPGTGAAEQGDVSRLLALGVGRLCGEPGAGACAGTPALTAAPAPPIPTAGGLLDVIDLPQPGSATGSWSGTEPEPAGATPAVIACDDTDFSAAPVRAGTTRTFVMLRAGLPDRFGLTENAGRLRSVAAARSFVDGVRTRFADCERRDLASDLDRLADTGSDSDRPDQPDLAAWRVSTEVADASTVDFLTAVVRRGDRVAQIGLVTAPGADVDARAFLALAQRALERLSTLSPRGRSAG